tara:strand:- start:231 stop:449 length:219 start_codon:yes stop_codon:yes gene_type:complete
MSKLKLLLGLTFLCVFLSQPQCAMCRVVAESSKDAGSTIANGLNTGILYLMSFPYILILCGLISIYFNKPQS